MSWLALGIVTHDRYAQSYAHASSVTVGIAPKATWDASYTGRVGPVPPQSHWPCNNYRTSCTPYIGLLVVVLAARASSAH